MNTILKSHRFPEHIWEYVLKSSKELGITPTAFIMLRIMANEPLNKKVLK
jgi:hypothetical protein